ncbi:Mucin-12 [Lobaria immixta]|nr:Mucin-12 [Lobaria immixta]
MESRSDISPSKGSSSSNLSGVDKVAGMDIDAGMLTCEDTVSCVVEFSSNESKYDIKTAAEAAAPWARWETDDMEQRKATKDTRDKEGQAKADMIQGLIDPLTYLRHYPLNYSTKFWFSKRYSVDWRKDGTLTDTGRKKKYPALSTATADTALSTPAADATLSTIATDATFSTPAADAALSTTASDVTVSTPAADAALSTTAVDAALSTTAVDAAFSTTAADATLSTTAAGTALPPLQMRLFRLPPQITL